MADVQKLAQDFLVRLYMSKGHSPQKAAAMAFKTLASADPMRQEINRVDNDPLRGDPLWAPGSLQGDWIARAEEERRAQAAKPSLPGYDTQPRFDIAGPTPAGSLNLPPDTDAPMPTFPPAQSPPFVGEEDRADERRTPMPPVFVGEEARADERPRKKGQPVAVAVPVPVPVPAEAAPTATPAAITQPSLLAGPMEIGRPSEGDSPNVEEYFRRKRNWKDEQGLLGRVL